MTEPLWTPSADRVSNTNMTRFIAQLEADWGVSLPDYQAAYDFAVTETEKFWSSVWSFCDIRAQSRGERVLVSAAAGATGILAVQIAKLLGCEAWGIAGGAIDIQKVNIASAMVGRRFNQRAE